MGADVQFDGKGNRIGGAALLAIVNLHDGMSGRQYRLPIAQDYAVVLAAQKVVAKLPKGAVPDEPLPPVGTLGFRVQQYGMNEWGKLFTYRQKLALHSLITATQKKASSTVTDLLALAIDRVASRSSSLCLWRYQADQEKVEHIFGRQTLSMVWDFAESVAISQSTGSFDDGVGVVAQCVESVSSHFARKGQAQLADACQSPLPDATAVVWFTDPPYYDAIPYSDLSDFFFVWLKRALPNHPLLRDPFDSSNPLTPKEKEIVQDEAKLVGERHKDREFFETTMGRAFADGRRVLKDDGISAVVFAHKTTEGWEALLSAMISSGWVITGSWPLTTEMPNRLRARESAALSASVHLVCRPRGAVKTGDWDKVLRALPKRVGDWMERLQGEGVRGADLVFACIGPALEIFSQYSKVETADGREVSLPEYLEKVWEVVGRSALEQVLGTAEARARNGAAGALEEDARLTALFLWTLQSTSVDSAARANGEEEAREEDEAESAGTKKKKGPTLIFDVVRRFAQPLGIRLPDWEGRIIETEKGVVRLLPVRERSMQLFGEDGVHSAASEIQRGGDAQLALFPETKEPTVRSGRGRRRANARASEISHRDATTLDRVHAAMLLQANGQANALRTMLANEQERSPEFLRLANALSALYPKESEEKRLLDAMLLAVPK